MKLLNSVLFAGLAIFISSTVVASNLSETASALKPGESIRMVTPLDGNFLSPPEDGSNFLQWASSGVWDPVRQEIRFVGKKHDSGGDPHRFLSYKASSDTWGIDRPPPVPVGTWGHGYDHNTIDPVTGEHYFRVYNSTTVMRWDGDWSPLPQMPQKSSIAATVSWFPGLGLVYADAGVIQYYDGSSWAIIDSSPPNFGYHVASEFNASANVLIIGGGNNLPYGVFRMGPAKALSRGADAPFNIGSSASGGVLAADPTSPSLIAWSKLENSWAEYDIVSDKWNVLERSSGDGSTPQKGLPNLSGSTVSRATIGIPVDTLGVIMFVQYIGSGNTPAGVWLYRHSPYNRVPRPNPPILDQ